MSLETPRPASPAWLHFRRFLARPGRVASVFASSPRLGRLAAEGIRRDGDDYVVEVGAGIGTVTRAILEAGVPPGRLVAVEIDREMAGFLQEGHPGITVLDCSAFDLAAALPDGVAGRVGTVVCGIPLRLMPPARRRELVTVMLDILRPGGRIVAYSHRPSSPIDRDETRVTRRRLAYTMGNVPPASVWAYEPAAG